MTVTLDSLAVVTGGGAGIGRAIAIGLAAQGRTVAILDVREELAKDTAQVIIDNGGQAEGFYVDIADMDSVLAVRDAVQAKHGTAQVLVNNAGWEEIHCFTETSSDFWKKILNINLLGPVAVTHAFLQGMIDAGDGGRIVSISSDAGRVGSSGEVVYSGAKGGIIGFTKALAREVIRYDITANAVCPGPTDTPLLRDAPQKLTDALISAVPARRLAQPEDIMNAVRFFASPDSGYITGQTLSVSGGLTMA
jgi:2-hydroxycyclohexanecarboxyl-CoA dehydrogenase